MVSAVFSFITRVLAAAAETALPDQAVGRPTTPWIAVAVFCIVAGVLLTAATAALILSVVVSRKKRNGKNGENPS